MIDLGQIKFSGLNSFIEKQFDTTQNIVKWLKRADEITTIAQKAKASIAAVVLEIDDEVDPAVVTLSNNPTPSGLLFGVWALFDNTHVRDS